MVKQLIQVYSEAIEFVKQSKDYHDAYDYLAFKYLGAGVCSYIHNNRIEGDIEWIDKYAVKAGYWCPPIWKSFTKEQMLKYLQFRLKVLKYEDSSKFVKFFKRKPKWSNN